MNVPMEKLSFCLDQSSLQMLAFYGVIFKVLVWQVSILFGSKQTQSLLESSHGNFSMRFTRLWIPCEILKERGVVIEFLFVRHLATLVAQELASHARRHRSSQIWMEDYPIQNSKRKKKSKFNQVLVNYMFLLEYI